MDNVGSDLVIIVGVALMPIWMDVDLNKGLSGSVVTWVVAVATFPNFIQPLVNSSINIKLNR